MSKQEFEHPSYGMISVSRVTIGGRQPRMFGSHVDYLPSYIQITLRRGTRINDIGYDRYYGGDEVIRLALTPTQYAEMISNPNSGFGVPCTMLHIQGEALGEPPVLPSEPELIREDFVQRTLEMVRKVEEGAEKIRVLLATSRLPKKTQEEVAQTYAEAVRFVGDAPYLVSCFQDATARTVSAAKQEVDAFVQHTAHAMGVEAIKNLAAPLAARPQDALALAGEIAKERLKDFTATREAYFTQKVETPEDTSSPEPSDET